jgi:hypothetical protein
MSETLCPHCDKPVSPGDFLCASCELMLNAQVSLAEAPEEPSLVRAMLSVPSPTGLHPIPQPPSLVQEAETVRAAMMMDHLTVPRLIAGLDLALRPLHPFEAYVISLIDGTYAVPTIARAAKLSLVEAQALFTSLRQRGVIELQRKEEPPARPAPKAPSSPPPAPPPRREPAPVASARAPQVPPNARPTPVAPTRVPAPVAAKPPGPPRRPTSLEVASPPEPPRPDSVLERAVAFERSGDIERAIQVLERAIAQVKEPAPLYNRLALILINQRRDFRKAEALLTRATELAPDNKVYQQNLFKVVALAAAKTGEEKKGPGLLGKLLKRGR